VLIKQIIFQTSRWFTLDALEEQRNDTNTKAAYENVPRCLWWNEVFRGKRMYSSRFGCKVGRRSIIQSVKLTENLQANHHSYYKLQFGMFLTEQELLTG
jgi:hypothetical protein